MNRQALLVSLWNQRDCFVPPLAVLAAFVLLVVLAVVVGELRLAKIQFQAIAGFPDKLGNEQLHAVVGIGLWWIFSVYLFWLVAIVGSLACLYVVWRSISDKPRAFRRAACGVLATVILVAASLVTYIGHTSTLVSLQNLIRHVKSLSEGLWTLMELTNGLGIVTIVLVVASAGICLAPAKSSDAVIRQLKQLHVLLYVGAAIVVTWVFQSRLLYGMAATGLIEEQKDYVESIAPTVSLVVGAVASIYLILTYFSSFFVLNRRYLNLGGAIVNASRAEERPKEERSPMTFLFSVWSRAFALLIPVLPGAFEFFFNFVERVTGAVGV